MKKIIAITLSILMLMASLTACSGKEEKSVSTDGTTSMQKVMLALGEAFWYYDLGFPDQSGASALRKAKIGYTPVCPRHRHGHRKP